MWEREIYKCFSILFRYNITRSTYSWLFHLSRCHAMTTTILIDDIIDEWYETIVDYSTWMALFFVFDFALPSTTTTTTTNLFRTYNTTNITSPRSKLIHFPWFAMDAIVTTEASNRWFGNCLVAYPNMNDSMISHNSTTTTMKRDILFDIPAKWHCRRSNIHNSIA